MQVAITDEASIIRLIASTLSLNGYGHNMPGVIDWPTDEDADD